MDNLGSINLHGMSDSYKTEVLKTFFAFNLLKDKLASKDLSAYLIETKIPSFISRQILADFIGLPWISSQINDDDRNLLEQIKELLSV